MINTTLLESRVKTYSEQCKSKNKEPTYKGIALMIGISGTTVSNVVKGSFNGHKYTTKPHTTRCISNNDFEVLRSLFDDREV